MKLWSQVKVLLGRSLVVFGGVVSRVIIVIGRVTTVITLIRGLITPLAHEPCSAPPRQLRVQQVGSPFSPPCSRRQLPPWWTS